MNFSNAHVSARTVMSAVKTRTTQLIACMLVCLAATAAPIPAVAATQFVQEQDEMATGSASTLVTAVIEAPDESGDASGTPATSSVGTDSGKSGLARMGDDDSAAIAGVLALASAALLLSERLVRRTRT